MNIQELIISVLFARVESVMSWGTYCTRPIQDGISFKVSALKFSGIVEIRYIQGKDLFRITFISKENKNVNHIEENVHLYELVDKIDSVIELVEDYDIVIKSIYKGK